VGKVGFDDLRISCVVGVHEKERVIPQEIIVDMRVETTAPSRDTMQHAIDYTVLASQVTHLAQQEACQLIETLAVRILDHIIEQFHVSWAWIRIRKPAALGGNGIALVEWEKHA
jgi:dihydroneopterin aldolase